MKAAGIAVALVALAEAAALAGASEPNNTFPTRSILPCPQPTGTYVHADTIAGGLPGCPDTTLGAFDAGGNLIIFSDDGSPLGDGKASVLLEVPINADGSIHLAVSGYDDLDFDGQRDYWEPQLHPQSGDFELYVDVYNAAGAPIDHLTYADTLSPGAVFNYTPPSSYPAGSFDAMIDNSVGDLTGTDPLDFVSFTGLGAGLPFVAEITAAGFDTMLGLFDDGGVLLAYDDDGGSGNLSLIAGIVPGSGNLNLAVTGWDDGDFAGWHEQAGQYTLEVTVVPEPCSAVLLLPGLLFLARRRRLSRIGPRACPPLPTPGGAALNRRGRN